MKYFDYMESHFVENNIKCHTAEVEGSGFNPWLNAEVKAAHSLISLQRKFYICMNVLKLLVGMVFNKIGLVADPRSSKEMLTEYTATAQAKIQKAQEQQRNNKLRDQGRGQMASDNVVDLNVPRPN